MLVFVLVLVLVLVLGLSDRSLGTASITDAGGVADIRSPRRASDGRDAALRRPRTAISPGKYMRGRRSAPSLPRNPSRRGDLISNVPPGQIAVFPALTLEMRCVLVGLR